MITTEKRFESDIESAFLSPAGGYAKGTGTYNAELGFYVDTLIGFVQGTQPKEWASEQGRSCAEVLPCPQFSL